MLSMLTSIICLAQAVYFEAGNQEALGKQAVAHVIMNRVRDQRFPGTVCDVIQEGKYVTGYKYPLKYRCSFTFYCDRKPEIITDQEVYDKSFTIAVLAYFNISRDVTKGATHYHATYVTPTWADSDRVTYEYQDHIFYRM